MGPIREFLAIVFATPVALHRARDAYASDPAGQAGVDFVLGRFDVMHKLHQTMHARLHQNADGMAAMDAQLELDPDGETVSQWPALTQAGAPPVDPKKHPFLAWLLSPHGMAWVMAIVNYVLTTFFHMTPLPPLPPLPSLAGDAVEAKPAARARR